MTMRTRVTSEGKVNVAVPVIAGTEVEVTIEPIDDRSHVSTEEKLRILRETAGSIPDFPFVKSPVLDIIPPLDLD